MSRITDSRLKNRKLPNVDAPQVDDQSLRQYLESVKEHIRMYEGDSGAPKERFVTIEELELAGMIGTKIQSGFASITDTQFGPVNPIPGGIGGGGDNSGGIKKLKNLLDVAVAGIESGQGIAWDGLKYRPIELPPFDVEPADQYDMIFRGTQFWENTKQQLQWNPDLNFLQLANAHGLNWLDQFGNTKEVLIFDPISFPTATPARNTLGPVAQAVGSGGTDFVVVPGAIIEAENFIVGDEYMLCVVAGGGNSSSLATDNEMRLFVNGAELAGSLFRWEGETSASTRGWPFPFFGSFVYASGDPQLQFHDPANMTSARVSYATMTTINLTTIGSSNYATDSGTQTQPLDDQSFVAGAASITIGDGVSDWMIFPMVRVDNYDSVQGQVLSVLSDGITQESFWDYEPGTSLNQTHIGSGMIVRLAVPTDTTFFVQSTMVTNFTADMTYTSLVAIRLNAFDQYVSYVDPDVPESAATFQDVLENSFTVDAATSNWGFWGSMYNLPGAAFGPGSEVQVDIGGAGYVSTGAFDTAGFFQIRGGVSTMMKTVFPTTDFELELSDAVDIKLLYDHPTGNQQNFQAYLVAHTWTVDDIKIETVVVGHDDYEAKVQGTKIILEAPITVVEGVTKHEGDVRLDDSIVLAWVDPFTAPVTLGEFPSDFAGDADLTSVELLLILDGSDGDTVYTGVGPRERVMTFVGSADLDDAEVPFPSLTTSLRLQGSNDSLSTPWDANLDLLDGDFTIEGWVWFDQAPGSNNEGDLLALWESGESDRSWNVTQTSGGGGNGNLSFVWWDGQNGNDSFNAVLTGGESAQTWRHWAVVREGDTLYMFWNGILLGSTSIAGVTINGGSASRLLRVGESGSGGNDMDGYQSNIRITKGFARYTATFTPPTDSFPLTEGQFNTFILGDPASPTVIDGLTLQLTAASTDIDGTLNVDGTVNVEGTQTWHGDVLFDNDTEIQWEDIADAATTMLNFAQNPVDDSDFASVVLLANFDGVDAATSFTEASNSALAATFISGAELDTAQFEFGTASLSLPSTDDWLTFPTDAGWDFGDDDFTVEFRVRFNGDPGSGNVGLMGHFKNESNGQGWYVALISNTLRFLWSPDGFATALFFDEAWNPATATWYTIAVVRTSGLIKMFVDGTQIGSDGNMAGEGTTSIFDPNRVLDIGRIDHSGVPLELEGWLEEIRITKGVARYTGSSYTVAVAAFPESGSNDEEFVVGDPAFVTRIDGSTVKVTGSITAIDFNAVPLSATGAATDYLDETGAYSVPGIGAASFTDLSDVDLSGAADNDLLFRSGGDWIDTAGALTWNATRLEIDAVNPSFMISDSASGGTDEKHWQWELDTSGRVLKLQLVDDAKTGFTDLVTILRTAMGITSFAFNQFIEFRELIQMFDDKAIHFGNGFDRGFVFDNASGELRFISTTDDDLFVMRDGTQLVINSSNNTDSVTFHHDLTDFSIAAVATVDMNWTGISGTYVFDRPLTATSFNAVPLTDAGAATNYLDESGAYSIPSGAGAVTFDDLTDVDVASGSDNDMLFRTGGVWEDTAGLVTWDASTFQVTGTIRTADAAGPRLQDEAATATNPTLIPNTSDVDTGIGWNTVDELSLIAGGIEIINLAEDDPGGTTTVSVFANSIRHSDSNGLEAWWIDTGASADEGKWRWLQDNSGQDLALQTSDDAEAVFDDAVVFERNNLSLFGASFRAGIVEFDGANIQMFDDEIIYIGTGFDFSIDYDSGANELQFKGTGDNRVLVFRDAMIVTFNDDDNNSTVTMQHDGADFNIVGGGAGTENITFTGFDGMSLDLGFYLAERTDAEPDISGFGQFWVDTENVTQSPQFTDEAGNTFPMKTGVTNAAYRYGSTTGDFAPGPGEIRFDSTTPASITRMSIPDLPASGLDYEAQIISWAVGDRLSFYSEVDPNDWLILRVTVAAVDFTGYYKVMVEHVDSGTIFTQLDNIRLHVSKDTLAGGGVAFDDLTDVDLSGAADDDMLFRSGGEWLDTGGLLTWDASTLAVTGSVTATDFNAVALTDAGAATNYLDESGAYSVPVGGFAHPDPHLLADGAVGAPAYSFSGDTDSGMWTPGDDDLAFSAGGVEALRFTEVGTGILEAWHIDATFVADTGQSQGGSPILQSHTIVSSVSSDGDSITLPAVFAIGTVCEITNGSTTYDIACYPASGDNLGQGTNAALNIRPGATQRFVGTVANTTWKDTYEQSQELYGHSNGGPAVFGSASITVPTLIPNQARPTTGIGNAGGDDLVLISAGNFGLQLSNNVDGVLPVWSNDVGLTAFATGGQTNAIVVGNAFGVFSTVATAGDSAKLRLNPAVGEYIVIQNDGAEAMDIFPGLGDDLGAGTDTAVSLAAGSTTAFIGTVVNATWTQLFVPPAGGSGDVTKVGTPVDNEIGVWTGDGTLEGDTNFQWDGSTEILTLSGAILGGAGSETDPTYSFSTDPDTGMYTDFADFLMFTAGGTRTFTMGQASFTASIGNGPSMIREGSTATNPTLVPAQGDSSTGIGGVTQSLDIIVGGVSRMHFDTALSTGNTLQEDLSFGDANGPMIQDESASATNPTFTPTKVDIDTGLGWGGADALSLIAGSIEGMRLTELNSQVINAYDTQLGITAFSTGGQTNAVQIDAAYATVTTVTSDDDSVKLPPVFALGSIVTVKNDDSNDLDVFPASGDDLGAGTDAAVTVDGGGSATFLAVSADATWTQILSQSGGGGGGGDVTASGSPLNNQIAVFTGATDIDSDAALTWDSAAAVLTTTGEILAGDGMTATPSYAFESDPNSGWKITSPGSGSFYWINNGTINWIMTSAYFGPSTTGNYPRLNNTQSSGTVPNLLPRNDDQNTGIGAFTDDALSLICGGLEALRLQEPVASTGDILQVWGGGNYGLTAHAGGGQPNGLITAGYNVYSTVATTGDSATLLQSPPLGTVIHIKNDAANSMDVFPYTGDDLGQGTDTALAIPGGESAVFMCTVVNTTWTQLVVGVGGGGDVRKVSTPVNNELGVWTGDGTLEGDTNLTWDATTLAVTGEITRSGNHVVEGYSTGRNVLRSIRIKIEPGATPNTNINVTDVSDTNGQGFNEPTITDATDLAASGSNGSWALSSDGQDLTLDITEDVVGVVSASICNHKINTAAEETYVTHITVVGSNLVLHLRPAGGNTNANWLNRIDASDRCDFLIAFMTSS